MSRRRRRQKKKQKAHNRNRSRNARNNIAKKRTRNSNSTHYEERPSDSYRNSIHAKQRKQDLMFVSIIIILLIAVIGGYFYTTNSVTDNSDEMEANFQNDFDGGDGDGAGNNDNMEIVWNSYETGLAQAENKNKPVIIDFYTDWCTYCTQMDEDTYSNSAVIEKAENFVCVKVDGDQRRDLISSYAIDGYPTTVFLNPSGKEIHREVGYIGPQQFIEDMDYALENS